MSSTFSKKVIEKYQNGFKINITSNYRNLLYRFYNDLFSHYVSNINIEITTDITPNNNLKDIKEFIKYESTFMSKKIASTITKYKHIHQLRTRSIIIYYFSKRDKINKKEVDDIKLCIYRIHCIKNYVNNHDTLQIAIYPTLFKKTINKITKKFRPLGIDNVNSGLTYYRGKENGTIILWRKEEIKKVIIHELLHALKVDYSLIMHGKLFEKYMMDLYKIDQFIGINESYIETLACLFNIIFYVIEHNLNKKAVINFLKVELFYCCTKAAQILNYYNLNSLKDLIVSSNKYFHQNSNVFSYYIVKTLLLFNFNNIYNLLLTEKCINSSIIIDNNIFCATNYLNILKSIYNPTVDKHIRMIIKEQKFINSSLRMTAIE